jgi:hypothetical protein
MKWPRSASDVVPTIRIPGGVIHATPQKKSSIGRSAEARSASLDLAASLLLLEQLHQRSKNHRRQRCARLQGPEEAGEALLDNDLAGKLNVGPNRLAGTGRDLRITLQAGEHGPRHRSCRSRRGILGRESGNSLAQ